MISYYFIYKIKQKQAQSAPLSGEIPQTNHPRRRLAGNWPIRLSISLIRGWERCEWSRQRGGSIRLRYASGERRYARWIDGAQNDLEMQRLEAVLSPTYPRKKINTT